MSKYISLENRGHVRNMFDQNGVIVTGNFDINFSIKRVHPLNSLIISLQITQIISQFMAPLS